MQGSSCTAGSSLGLSRAVLNLLTKPTPRNSVGQQGLAGLPLNLRGALVNQLLQPRTSVLQDLIAADAFRQSALGFAGPFFEPQRYSFTTSPVVCQVFNARAEDRRASAADEAPVVRLRGLPWDTTSQDIEKFLNGVKFGSEGVILTLDPRGRPSGEAIVECASVEDADLALSKNNGYLGTRWIEVFPAAIEDLEFAKKNQNLAAIKPELTEEDLSAFGNPDPAYPGVVRMRGIPFRAVEDDVVEFFTGYEVVPKGVFLCKLADGRLSGEAYVEFKDEDTARQSLDLNREQMGRRYVELFPATKADMVGAIKINSQRVAAAWRETAGSTFVKLRGLPFDVEEYDIQEFFTGYDIKPGSIKITESFQGRKTGEAFVEFSSAAEADRAMQENNKEIGVRYIELFRVREEEVRGGGGSSGGSDSRRPPRSNGLQADPQCTVKMRGLPFRATVSDIVMFFEGFDIVKESIALGTNSDGRPSGEAWVAFTRPEEAARAIRQMNREYMGNRFVELFPA